MKGFQTVNKLGEQSSSVSAGYQNTLVSKGPRPLRIPYRSSLKLLFK